MEINGKLGNLTPLSPKPPEPMAAKFGVGDVGDIYPCAKFHYNSIRGFCFSPRLAPARAGAYTVTRLVFWVLAPYREAICTDFHDLYVK